MFRNISIIFIIFIFSLSMLACEASRFDFGSGLDVSDDIVTDAEGDIDPSSSSGEDYDATSPSSTDDEASAAASTEETTSTTSTTTTTTSTPTSTTTEPTPEPEIEIETESGPPSQQAGDSEAPQGPQGVPSEEQETVEDAETVSNDTSSPPIRRPETDSSPEPAGDKGVVSGNDLTNWNNNNDTTTDDKGGLVVNTDIVISKDPEGYRPSRQDPEEDSSLALDDLLPVAETPIRGHNSGKTEPADDSDSSDDKVPVIGLTPIDPYVGDKRTDEKIPQAQTDQTPFTPPVDESNDEEPTNTTADDFVLSEQTYEVGSFRLKGSLLVGQPQLTLYFYSPGGNKGVQVQISRDDVDDPGRALITHRGPDEAMKFWKYVDAEYPAQYPADGNMTLIDQTFPMQESGVHQVRINIGNYSNKTVSVTASQGVLWGYSVQNGLFTKQDFLPFTLYATMPVHRHSTLRLFLRQQQGVQNIYDMTTNTLLPPNQYTIAKDATLDSHLWRLSLIGDWQFRAIGMPLILTTSEQAANAIGHSVERLPNGGLVAHKFQTEIFNILPQILAHTGNTASLYALSDNYPATQEACKAPNNEIETIKNLWFMHYRGMMQKTRWVLSTHPTTNVPMQQVDGLSTSSGPDPSDLWNGSIGVGMLKRQLCEINADCTSGSPCDEGVCATFNPSLDRWDVLRPLYFTTEPVRTFTGSTGGKVAFGLGAGNSVHYASTARDMMYLATTQHVCNPFGPKNSSDVTTGETELFYRGVAASLLDLMAISEDHWLPGLDVRGEENSFHKMLMFSLGQKIAISYYTAAPHLTTIMTQDLGNGQTLGEKVKELWTEGLRRLVDVLVPGYITTSMNASSQQAYVLELFAQGSQMSTYRDISRYFAGRFIDGAHDAGFFIETGIDATYSGITHNSLAKYYQLTKDDPQGPDLNMLEAMRKAYEFFNYTISPEPDGTAFGGFNYANRTTNGFYHEQYNGAHFLLDELDEVAVWTRDNLYWSYDKFAINLYSWSHSFNTHSGTLYFPENMGFMDVGRKWDFIESRVDKNNLKFPAETNQNYIREVSDQLVVVKKDDYYATVYVGHPTTDIRRYLNEDYDGNGIRDHVETLQEPLNVASYVNGNRWRDNSPYMQTPFLVGGITQFWTPDFGNALISTNMSPYMQHGLVLQYEGKLYWARYESVDYTLNGDELTMTGEIVFPYNTDTPWVLGYDETIDFERTYTFLDDSIEVELTVESPEAIQLEGIFENIPVPVCYRDDCSVLSDEVSFTNDALKVMSLKRAGSKIYNAGGQEVSGNKNLSSVFVKNSNNQGMKIDFGTAQNIDIVSDGIRWWFWKGSGEKIEVELGRIEIPFPTNWNAGDEHSVSYTIEPL